MVKKLLFIGVFLGGYSSICIGQNLNFFGIIPSISQTGRISNRFNYNLFASEVLDLFDETIDNRYYPSKPLQLYIQPSLIYVHTPNLNFAVSLTYNYQRNNPDIPYNKEWRPWQQVVYAHNVYSGRMSHRLRFEERFIKNETTGNWPLGTRLRYQIGFSVPLQGRTLEAKECYFNCYNESYLTLTVPKGTTRSALYSEDWIYVGIGYQTTSLGRVEIGPLLQFNVRNVQHDLRNLYLLQLSWITNFEVPRKQDFTN